MLVESERSAPVVVVVGNPSPGSRTLSAASMLGDRLASLLSVDSSPVVIDVADLGPALMGWGDPTVAAATQVVRSARALVVASPTYKASFTGLLKLFLDQFDQDELGGVPTVPMMTGGGPAHSLAVEVHLRPVLIEIGASCPTRGLYIHGDAINDPASVIEAWASASAAILRRLAGS